MQGVLVGMHRAAEDKDGVVVLERLRGRRCPLEAPFVELMPGFRDERAEQRRASVLAVDDRENSHQAPPLAETRFTSRSRRSCRAFVAAWDTRRSGLSGSS